VELRPERRAELHVGRAVRAAALHHAVAAVEAAARAVDRIEAMAVRARELRRVGELREDARRLQTRRTVRRLGPVAVDRRRPALMVVCSQSDRDAAASKAYLRAQLEKELSKLKETRPSLAAEGDDAGASAAILLGRKGRDFEFAEDCPCETQFCEFSAKPVEAGKSGGGVREVEVFIRDFIA